MPSPFPGMDPYLESPDIWPDFHDALAGEIRAELNRLLPPPYYARLEMRPEIGVIEDVGQRRWIVPDVAVVRTPAFASASTAAATLAAPRTEPTPGVELVVSREPIRHQFVEIRDAARGHELVTLIEIVSPTNKLPGPDRRAYLRKQEETLDSDANLVEIDLLRAGERMCDLPEVNEYLETRREATDYLISVNRAAGRDAERCNYQLFALALPDSLPCIGVPLRGAAQDVLLDLQWIFNQAYDRGPYLRGAVDYSAPPQPPLREDLRQWLAGRLSAQRSSAPGNSA